MILTSGGNRLLSAVVALSMAVAGLPAPVGAFSDVAVTPIVAAPPGHDTAYVVNGMGRAARDARTFRADIEVAEWKPKKKRSRDYEWKTQTGTLEVAKGQGARMVLRRDAKRFTEYAANPRQLVEYDGNKNRVSTLPASIPFVSGLVKRALNFDPTLITDADSLTLRGVQNVGGTPAYRLDGTTPGRYAAFGLKRQPVKIWLRQSDFSPIRIELPKMDRTIINLKNIERDRPISPGRFEFRHPPGATVKRVLGI